MNQKKAPVAKLNKRRSIYLMWGVLAIVVSYFSGSRAFDTGSWWEYLATLVLFILGVKGLILSVKSK